MELPFELYNQHKVRMKAKWKHRGLIMDNFEEIYQKYIYATHCELCNKEFKSTKERVMEHNHETGEFRNICCVSCNQKKADVLFTRNTLSGYKGISRQTDKGCIQGYYWYFSVTLNGKRKTIKNSTDLEFLIKFAEDWKKKNVYNT